MKSQFVRFLVSITLIMGTLWACNPFRPQIRKSPQGHIPQTFSLYAPGPERPDKWWEEFNDPELNALIEKTLSGNFTLKQAWARLNQAKALSVQAGSALFPELSVAAGASRVRQRTETQAQETSRATGNGPPETGRETENGSPTRKTTINYSLGLMSSYELDLWGRIRSKREASLLEANASREDLNAAAMSLAAEVTEHWVNIISQGIQKRLLQRQLKTNSTYLELVELRFRKAMVSALDVYQQKQVVEQVKAEIPLIEAQEQLLLHELALLLGKPPRTIPGISRVTLPVPEDIPATGLPADLLAGRPDVRAAGLRLQAADWQVAAARADRLPAINLTAEAIFSAATLGLIFDNWMLSLAGNLVAPIFDGRQRAAEVDRTRAVVDANLSVYRETVLTAIKEVEDALVSETKKRQHIKALQLQIGAAQKAFDQARDRYRKGLNDYLPVLTQLLAVQGLERNLIKRQTELIIDRVNLYRALGGTWMKDLRPSPGSPKASGT